MTVERATCSLMMASLQILLIDNTFNWTELGMLWVNTALGSTASPSELSEKVGSCLGYVVWPWRTLKHLQHVKWTVSLVFYMYPINDLQNTIKCTERGGGRQRGVVSISLHFCTHMHVYTCVLVSLRAQKCVRQCVHVWEHLSPPFHQELRECKSLALWVCVYTFSCVSVYLQSIRKWTFNISSWLHFPELSLMALCSGAVLLLPTYFMTSCAPHATLLLLNNSTSPLSSVQRLPSLTFSAYFSLNLSYFCSTRAEYVGQAALDWMPLKCVTKLFSKCAYEYLTTV